MNPELIEIALVGVTAVSILNLILIIRLSAWFGSLPMDTLKPLTFPIGQPLPYFEAQDLKSRQTITRDTMNGQATVFLFLSLKCLECRSKIPEIQRIMPLAEKSGVAIWIVAMESVWRHKKFLQHHNLLHAGLSLDRRLLLTLNPRFISPYYIFVDAEGQVVASHTIGDENWQNFVRQMDETSKSDRPMP